MTKQATDFEQGQSVIWRKAGTGKPVPAVVFRIDTKNNEVILMTDDGGLLMAYPQNLELAPEPGKDA